MASGKISPRQKMINMMYLVLTALLALNISKDMLKAFAKVNNSLISNLSNIKDQSDVLYSNFKESAENSPLKVGAQYEVATMVAKEAQEFRAYVQELNDILITSTGGYKEDGVELKGADNKSKVSNIMLMKPDLKGEEFKLKLNAYKDFLLGLEVVQSDDELKNIISSSFNTDDMLKDDIMVSWEMGTFNNVPLIAVLTFLSQYQVDASTVESKIVENLYASVSADDMKFSSVQAQVISPKNYVMEGDSFKASISIAAFDSTQSPTIIVTDVFIGDTLPDYTLADTLPVALNGKGMYSIPAAGIGTQKRAAKILLTTETGIKEYEEIFEYQVAKPMAVVSPTKMNVFYRGVPNPIDVSVPGFSPEDLEVSGTGISLKRIKPGQFEATVRDNVKGDAKVTVKAGGRTIGKPIEFRLKRIPSPTASINGKTQGTMSRGKLSKAQGIAASLTNFPFDLKYTVTSFDVRLKDGEYTKTIKVKGNKFKADVKEKILKLKPGSDISFTNIKAQGPDGRKQCGAIVLTVQ